MCFPKLLVYSYKTLGIVLKMSMSIYSFILYPFFTFQLMQRMIGIGQVFIVFDVEEK